MASGLSVRALPEPGHRVSVRRRLDPRHSDSEVGDVVGWLLPSDTDGLLVERRDGTLVVIPRAAILLCRVVPDRPGRSRAARSLSPDELARICSLGWPGLEEVSLGDWRLRAAAGFTGRANSALVAGDPGVDVATALARVVDFYRNRGLPPRAQVVTGSPSQGALLEAGWTGLGGDHGSAFVQTLELSVPPTADARVRSVPGLRADWLAVYGRPGDAAAQRHVLTGPPRVNLLAVGDPAVAIARAVATGEWVGIAAVATRPDQRRQGLARALVDTALAWGWTQGCDKAYVQVEASNAPALRLYASYGFATHHRYDYLVPADAA